MLSDAPEYDFVFTYSRVEIPRTVLLHQGNRKRPVFGAHDQAHGSVRFCDKAMHLLVFHDEAGPSIRIFDRVAGRKYILCGSSKDVQGNLLVLSLHGVKDGATGRIG